ncbi:MAG: hypothetical protein LCI03_06185 [Actinobacteria bacterium]|nr:hypothetical protein [Actinomycetota bacterium]
MSALLWDWWDGLGEVTRRALMALPDRVVPDVLAESLWDSGSLQVLQRRANAGAPGGREWVLDVEAAEFVAAREHEQRSPESFH